jgi:hypothetical protein
MCACLRACIHAHGCMCWYMYARICSVYRYARVHVCSYAAGRSGGPACERVGCAHGGDVCDICIGAHARGPAHTTSTHMRNALVNARLRAPAHRRRDVCLRADRGRCKRTRVANRFLCRAFRVWHVRVYVYALYAAYTLYSACVLGSVRAHAPSAAHHQRMRVYVCFPTHECVHVLRTACVHARWNMDPCMLACVDACLRRCVHACLRLFVSSFMCSCVYMLMLL